MGKFLEKQAAMPDLKECVALEYYEDSLDAALAREFISVQKPQKGKSFSLRVPLALSAELSSFVCKHQKNLGFAEALKEDIKSLQIELNTSSSGGSEQLRAHASHF